LWTFNAFLWAKNEFILWAENFAPKIYPVFLCFRIPTPALPRVDLVPTLLSDAVGIAIVCFVITLSMGKLFAKRHRYPVNAGQVGGLLATLCFICTALRPSFNF
jgi:hypothetical protein